ncbi:MAG TPA: hypothetical protein VHR72_00060 [Gemmataceae bacterium]|jgi:hypothetical protein|nr:hypothetical protein [Gemmataceae bacterium]
MTQMMSPNCNGKARKSLASQLDRFDAMLDGLADAIPQAVAETIRTVADQTVREAVHGVLTEILTDLAVLKKIHATAAPAMAEAPVATSPKPCSLAQRLSNCWAGTRAMLGKLRAVCATQVERLRSAMSNLGRRIVVLCAPLALMRRFAAPLAIALSIGVAMAAVAWFGGPLVGATLSGLGGVGASLALQAGMRLRRMFPWDLFEAV